MEKCNIIHAHTCYCRQYKILPASSFHWVPFCPSKMCLVLPTHILAPVMQVLGAWNGLTRTHSGCPLKAQNVHQHGFKVCLGIIHLKKDGLQKEAIYLWRKVVCFVLFCFVCTYETHQTRMLQIMFLVSLESSQGGGCMGLVSWHLDLRCIISCKLNNFFTKKLN